MYFIWLSFMALMLFILFIISKRKTAEKALKESEQRFTRIAKATPIGIFQTDLNGSCIFINDSYKKIVKITQVDALGDGWSNFIYPEDKQLVFNEWSLSVKENRKFNMDYRQVMPDGSFIWIHCESDTEYDDDGNKLSYIGTIQDITEQKDAEEKIRYQAYYDDLTGLPNRSLTIDRLSGLLNESDRDNKKVAILFIDLDDFKKINDSLGHETGDNVLIEAGKRFKSIIRAGDTIGRFGGDEFIMLIGHLNNTDKITTVVEKIINQFNKVFTVNNHNFVVTTSIGVALYPDNGKDASELLQRADLAMYQAKNLGRNTSYFYTEKLNEGMSRRIEIEDEMRGALRRKEFSVVYQPKVNLLEGNIIGAEALMRWNNQKFGVVSPAEFIPIAEKTDLINDIGEFVLTEALSFTAQWRDLYKLDFRIAVNLSPNQFRDSQLIGCIQYLINKYELPATSLELEITEGILLNKYIDIGDSLNKLAELGISLAMDDFGTGYSSLSYLRTYPFNVVKIDRSFITDIATDPADCELIVATIAMAHALNLSVVAEGIESDIEYAFLKKHHCDYGQGDLFSKAISADTLNELLAAQNNSKT